VHKGFWWENLKERDHLEGVYLEARIIIKRIFKIVDAETCIGLMWFRKGASGVLL
jgi:hypothetical protein